MSDVWSRDGLTPPSPIAGLPAMGRTAAGIVRIMLLDADGNLLQRKLTTATMSNSAVSVTTNTVILSSSTARIAWAIIHESAADTLYIGAAGVTAANGFPLLSNQPFVSGDFHGELRGTSSGGAISVRVLEWTI